MSQPPQLVAHQQWPGSTLLALVILLRSLSCIKELSDQELLHVQSKQEAVFTTQVTLSVRTLDRVSEAVGQRDAGPLKSKTDFMIARQAAQIHPFSVRFCGSSACPGVCNVHTAFDAPPDKPGEGFTFGLSGLRCIARVLSMARFANDAELETFLVKLDPDFGPQGSVAAVGSIASDRQVAQQLLMFPLQQAP
ncbi:hypothetical protein WJX77_009987 [Trebouxia sp. C0004]